MTVVSMQRSMSRSASVSRQSAHSRPARRSVSNAQPRIAVRLHAAETETSSNGVGVDTAAATALNMLDFDDLSEIVRMVQDTDVVDFELNGKNFSLAIKKAEALRAAEPQYQVVHAAAPVAAAPAAAAPPPPAAAPAPAAPAPAPAAPPAPAKVDGIEMTSPMAGTFYRAPAPGEPMFVKEGDRVTKGQTIGIIEAMKLMNEIEAEVSGEVVKFVVENGSSINPGQPLLVIRP